MRFPMVFVLLACVGGCLSCRTYDPKIVGGWYVFIHRVPYTVQIRLLNKHMCGGTIISPKWVVTAAHCFEACGEECPDYFRILSGSSWRSFGTVHRVSKIIVHESYEYDHDYDIALMQVSKPFKIGKRSVKAAGLPEEGSTPKEGTIATTSGWGHFWRGVDFLSFLLKAANVPIVGREKCREYYNGTGGDITDRMICAGLKKGGRDACQGDSGGPLVIKKVLVGVVSWGKGCAEPKFPGVYADVGYFRKWIKSKTGI